MNGCVLIPTFNESKVIFDLVTKLKKYQLKIIVIDDGSSDDTKSLVLQAGAEVIVHSRNMGKGASLRSGFKRSVKENFDFTIVMDGDGQHHPDDVGLFLDTFKEGNVDLLIGNRMDNADTMPYPRWLTNKLMSMLISSICKQYIPDTQCGFRLIRNSILKDMVIATSNYEIESEMLIEAAKKKYRIASVSIRTIYEGQDSQINPIVDTIRFFKFLLKDWLREGNTIIREFLNDVVIKQGSLLFLASLLCNLLNLIFWLVMIRKLHYIEYGILNTMVSFLAILGLPSLILQTVLARYFAEFKAAEKKESVQALFRAFIKRIAVFGSLFAVVIFFLSPTIAHFLQLNSKTYIYASIVCIIASSFLILTISTMQGMHLFERIAVNSLFLGFSKLFIGACLVFVGLQAFGAFLGFILAEIVAMAVSLLQLPAWIFKMTRKAYQTHKPFIRLKEVYVYFLPVSVAFLAYNLFVNMDVIMVKHFFNASDAGIYSIVQTVGKILLYLSSSIALVFFPVTIQQTFQKKNTIPLLKKCLLFVGLLSVSAALLTFAFPGLMLTIVSGKALPLCVPLVRFIILPMSIFSIVYIFIFYHLSVGNFRFIIVMFLISLLQNIFIVLFHQTLFNVIAVLFMSSLFSLAMCFYSIRRKKKND